MNRVDLIALERTFIQAAFMSMYVYVSEFIASCACFFGSVRRSLSALLVALCELRQQRGCRGPVSPVFAGGRIACTKVVLC